MLDKIKRIIAEGDVVKFTGKFHYKRGDVVTHPDLEGPHVFHRIVKDGEGKDIAHVYPVGMDIKKRGDVTEDPTGFKGWKRVEDPGRLRLYKKK